MPAIDRSRPVTEIWGKDRDQKGIHWMQGSSFFDCYGRQVDYETGAIIEQEEQPVQPNASGEPVKFNAPPPAKLADLTCSLEGCPFIAKSSLGLTSHEDGHVRRQEAVRDQNEKLQAL